MGAGGIEPPPTGPKPEILSIKLCAPIFLIGLSFYMLRINILNGFKETS